MQISALMAGALALACVSSPALAQSDRAQNEHRQHEARKDARAADQEYREDMRDARRERASSQRETQRHARASNRGWRGYHNYDWDRVEPGRARYDAGRYHRSSRTYGTRQLSYDDRVYRGQNGRYYCRRSDGTTGLIIGAAAGGLLGNALVRGDSQILGTILGAAGGGIAGRAIDRSNVRCR
jgi:hypothetical protein